MMNGGPIDSAIDPCGEFLYVLNGARGSISAFLIEREGHPALIQIYENTLLPTVGAQGIAVI
jgi:6-phosphogluconolactonase (cycloisomerase 2 family)